MQKSLEILQGLLTHMEQALAAENWARLAVLDAEFYAQLEREPFSALSSREQGLYRAAYEALFVLHQTLFEKCSAIQSLNIESLNLLRQQKNAGLVYQTVQEQS